MRDGRKENNNNNKCLSLPIYPYIVLYCILWYYIVLYGIMVLWFHDAIYGIMALYTGLWYYI